MPGKTSTGWPSPRGSARSQGIAATARRTRAARGPRAASAADPGGRAVVVRSACAKASAVGWSCGMPEVRCSGDAACVAASRRAAGAAIALTTRRDRATCAIETRSAAQRQRLVRGERAEHQRPPPSTCGAGASCPPSQAQATPKTISSSASSAASGALSARAAATDIRHGIASCATPSSASQRDVVRRAANGSASGKRHERRQHRADQHRRQQVVVGARARLRWITVQLIAAAIGTPSATTLPSRWRAIGAR